MKKHIIILLLIISLFDLTVKGQTKHILYYNGNLIINNNNILYSNNYEDEVKEWVYAAMLNGSDVSFSEVSILNDFVVSIKNAGLRDKILRMNLFFGPDLPSVLTPIFVSETNRNAKIIGNNYDVNSGFTISDYQEYGLNRGLKGDLTSYLSTGLNPSTTTELYEDSSMYGLILTNEVDKSSSYIEFGGRSSTTAKTGVIINNTNNKVFVYVNDNSTPLLANTDYSQGRWIFQRTSSVTKEYWRNGYNILNSSGTRASKPSIDNLIFGFSNYGTPSYISNKTISAYWIGNKMTQNEISKFDKILKTYQNDMAYGYIPLYILWGQSNMRGRGDKDSTNYTKVQDVKMLDWEGNTIQSMEKTVNLNAQFSTKFGCELTFGDSISKNLGRKILIFKFAYDDTRLDSSYSEWYPRGGILFKQMIDTLDHFIAKWDSMQSPIIKLAGLCTLQGESDGLSLISSNSYEDNFNFFLDTLNVELNKRFSKTDNYKIAIGRLPSFQSSTITYLNTIRTAQENVVTDNGYNLINLDSLSPYNNPHMTSKSYEDLGNLFYQIFKQ